MGRRNDRLPPSTRKLLSPTGADLPPRMEPIRMSLPPKEGLYDPSYEHDACGIGMVANINGTTTHDIVRKGVDILLNLEHRGASGCDPLTGDGAGILTQIPDKFFRIESKKLGFVLPEAGNYGAGIGVSPERQERTRSMPPDSGG